MNDNYSDDHFVDTYKMVLLDGEGFTGPQRGTGPEGNQVILNEAAVKKTGMEEPIGKHIRYGGDYRGEVTGDRARIVGVLKDFHFLSAHNVITPMMIRLLNEEETGWQISVRIGGTTNKKIIAYISHVFKEVFPDQVFDYSYVTHDIAGLYTQDQELGNVVLYISILALFIACLGIYGLVSFTTSARTKEIGIRKVIGSSVSYLYMMFAREFVIIILIASVVAYPVAFMMVDQWLQNFPYRVTFSVGPFLFATILVLCLTLLSMTFRVLRAVRVNPVDSIRYE